MPFNKNFSARQRVIDRMLQRKGGATVQEIMDGVNEELRFHGLPVVTSRSTIYSDLDFISSVFGAEVIHTAVGRFHYHRYADPSFSLYRLNLPDEEVQTINRTLDILSRFQGVDGFDWVGETMTRLKHSLFRVPDGEEVIHFQAAPGYCGTPFLFPVFEAIRSRRPIAFVHQPFGKASREWVLHPYLLVQFDLRWYVVGRPQGELFSRCFGLDRFLSMRVADVPWVENNGLVEYERDFGHLIGIKGYNEPSPEGVKLFVLPDEVEYLRTAPIHRSQSLEVFEDHAVATLEVTVNYELKQRLLHYCRNVFVLGPQSLADELYEVHRKQCEFHEGMLDEGVG